MVDWFYIREAVHDQGNDAMQLDMKNERNQPEKGNFCVGQEYKCIEIQR